MKRLLRTHGSLLILVLAALFLIAWVASGALTREPPVIAQRSEPEPMRVAVTTSRAETIERRLALQGEVLPDQLVTVRAETAGRIASLSVAQGTMMRAGDEIARIAMDDRDARLRRAEAAVAGREADHRAALQLAREGFQAQLRVESALADLEAARAELEAVRLDIANTRVRTPIDGMLDRRLAETGDYVARGDEVARVIENDPLKAVVQVPQHEIHRVRPGSTARVVFGDGDARQGEITYVAALADTATRTFRVEIRVANPQRSLPAGISARIEIPVEQVAAHRISTALISLDEQGRLGVKTVGDDDHVVFHVIEPIRADADGLWVAGLPEQARLITVGQGFVNPGEPVRVSESGDEAPH